MMKTTFKKRSLVVMAAIALSTVLLFQNCGNGTFVTDSSGTTISFASLSSLAESFDFIYEPKIGSSITADQYGRVESFQSVGDSSASLHPPFSGAGTRLNLEAAPVIDGSTLSFDLGQTLLISKYDLNKTYSSEYTIGLTVSGMEIKSAHSALRLVDLYPPESTEYNGHIYIQLDVEQIGGKPVHRINAGVWYSPTVSVAKAFHLPDGKVKDKYFIMVVVSSAPSGFRLFVNGQEHLGDTQGGHQILGNPSPLPRNVRNLGLNGAHNEGAFKLYSMFTSRRAISQNEIIRTHLGIAEREGMNFSGGIGGVPVDTGPSITYADLMRAGDSRGIFANSCVSCHSAALPSGGLNLADRGQTQSRIGAIIDRMEGRGAVMPPTGALGSGPVSLIRQWQSGGFK